MSPASRENGSARQRPSTREAGSGRKNGSGSGNGARSRGSARSRGRVSAATRGSGRERRGGGWLAKVGPRWGALLVLTAVTLLVLALYFTPLLGVRSVRVEGNRALGEQEVLAAAEVPLGESMLRVDTDAIRSRLRENPKVASVQADRSWPSTVRLEIEERTPAAFVRDGGAVRLVDAGGVPFNTVPQPPAGLPELQAPSPDDPLVRDEMSVLASLPPELRGQVLAVTAGKPSDLRLRLTGDREVKWGSLRESQRKASVLPLLLTQPGRVYNVTSPDLPTVA